MKASKRDVKLSLGKVFVRNSGPNGKLEREEKERKRKQSELFKKKYNKVRVFKFPPRDKINTEKHFYFPKFLNEFPRLSKSALAVYPVLCSCADFENNEWFHLSQKTISKMAGISEAEVQRGVRSLVDLTANSIDFPFLKQKLTNEGGRRFYNYKVGFIRKNMLSNQPKFIFHTCVIFSGVWSELSPRAKALYLSMRNVARFDCYLYCEIEGILVDFDEGPQFFNEGGEYNDDFYLQNEEYRNRKWDVANVPLSELCRNVNIASSNIQPIIDQLERYELIERVCKSVFKVYLKPKMAKNDTKS